MHRRIKLICFKLGIFIFILITANCFKDRLPNNPLQYETRRPEVAHIIPVDGDSVTYDSITVYFDEEMDKASVENAFTVSLVVNNQPWTQLNSVASLAQSGSDPNFLFVARRERGAFYSENGGESWQFCMGLSEHVVRMVRIDPNNSSLIYASTDSALMKSSDGGMSWFPIQNGLPDDVQIKGIDFDPTNSSTVWLGTNYGIYYSNNAGESWIAGGSLPSWRDDKDIVKITVDPTNSATVYAATLGRFVYKTTDGGTTWEMKRGETGSRLGASSIYDIVVDPDTSSIVYAATINRGIYKSIDAGDNWQPVNEGMDDLETRNIVLNSMDSDMLFVATNSALYFSDDGANSWASLSSPEPDSVIVDFLINPQNSENLLFATKDNLFQSFDRAESWRAINKIATETITFDGTFGYELWSDTLKFVDLEGDTVDITPHRYNDILAAYDAGLRPEPPKDVDPNPEATKMVFTPFTSFPKQWKYRVRIRGAFESGTLRENYGARDVHGMSLEFDYMSYFMKN